MYAFVTNSRINHAAHMWEVWHPYPSAHMPEIHLGHTPVVCHTCQAIIL